MEGQVPTNSEYLQATQKALRAAGVPEPSAKRITEQAAAQQEYYGLQPNNPVPNVPAQMNQAKPKAQPNAGPVPVGKNQP